MFEFYMEVPIQSRNDERAEIEVHFQTHGRYMPATWTEPAEYPEIEILEVFATVGPDGDEIALDESNFSRNVWQEINDAADFHLQELRDDRTEY